MEHYANMVDLFSRAGCLDEAYCFIKAMPLEPNENIWLCFLSACKSHRAFYLGEIASHHLLKLNPQGSGSYTQVTNFYGQMGLLEQAASVRLRMKEAGLLKNPGCSWVEVMGGVQMFYSGDLSLPFTKEIHAFLQTLQRTMKLTEEFIA
ncbi:hypothetical protein HPP92_007331 [Vanilla planifolia]|uniref:Pentatricopeptide repeat-containing protein n=1 Tax=Vanilla planifolia TaxID=51239 RepID=A0A835RHC4_VANPL|nr:hypothetical protein HPP92_007535 [Vanilla planifolia]KAG0490468.1 hypothetical protein HPP92_007331 [Vanilla planifolia]